VPVPCLCCLRVLLVRGSEAYASWPRPVAGGKATVAMQAGDRLVIHTPGAGGYGPPAPAPASGSETSPQSVATPVPTMWNVVGSAAATPTSVDALRAKVAAMQRISGGDGNNSGGNGAAVETKGSVAEYTRLQESA
jgi:N-methylhydantoinase B/oxoprolinase/acetone carboxylase alpha subunit